jgi:hypothetical protein
MKKLAVLLILMIGSSSAQTATAKEQQKAVGAYRLPAEGNGIQYATQFPGAELGAQVMEAIAALHGNCGLVVVPVGNYNLKTKIMKPRCVMLDFQNSIVSSTITDGPSITTGSFLDSSSGQYEWGGIRNLKLVGPGYDRAPKSIGIWFGGDTSGAFAPKGNNDFGSSYTNLNIRAFNYAMAKGIAYQITLISNTLDGNQYGWYEPGQFGGENIHMYGMQFLNNHTYGVYAPNQPANEFNCSFCSFDYNGVANIYVMNGNVTLMGGHMERCQGYDIDGPVTTSAAMILNIVGVTFVNMAGTTSQPGACKAFTGADPAYIHVTGRNSNVTIGGGVELIRNHPMASFIHWDATGSSNALNVQPYLDPASSSAIGLPTLQAGAQVKIASLSIPLYDQYVSKNQYFRGITVGQAQGGKFPGTGSIFATGFIGASENQGGNLPTVGAFPFGGGYIGWNSENIGDVDLLSPVPASTPTANAFNFYVNSTGRFQKAFSIQHNGGFKVGTAGTFGIDGSGNALINSVSFVAGGEVSSAAAHFPATSITIGPHGSTSSWSTGSAQPNSPCVTGDLWSNRSGKPYALYVCQSGSWVGK